MDTAIVICKTCGMPATVIFNKAGKIEKIYSVCGHVKQPTNSK